MGSLKRILEDRTAEGYEHRIAQLEAVLWPLIDIVEAELESDPEPDDLTSWKMAIRDARAALETLHESREDTGGEAVLASLQSQDIETVNVRLRDKFAIAALQGILSNHGVMVNLSQKWEGDDLLNNIATMAYWHADAMLTQRAKGAGDA